MSQRAARVGEGDDGTSYLAVVRHGGVAVLQVCEHDEPVVRPLRRRVNKYPSMYDFAGNGIGTYKPRDEVETPNGMEADLVYPHG